MLCAQGLGYFVLPLFPPALLHKNDRLSYFGAGVLGKENGGLTSSAEKVIPVADPNAQSAETGNLIKVLSFRLRYMFCICFLFCHLLN